MGKQLGQYIKVLREKRGFSQGEVAKLLSLKTAQSISNIERGVSPLPKAKINRLADILGVRKNELISLVLSEVQDRYSRAVGVKGKSVFSFNDLTTQERGVLQSLAERLRSAKNTERSTICRRVAKLI